MNTFILRRCASLHMWVSNQGSPTVSSVGKQPLNERAIAENHSDRSTLRISPNGRCGFMGSPTSAAPQGVRIKRRPWGKAPNEILRSATAKEMKADLNTGIKHLPTGAWTLFIQRLLQWWVGVPVTASRWGSGGLGSRLSRGPEFFQFSLGGSIGFGF